MERNIKKKVNDYINEFKTNLQKWLNENEATIVVNEQQKTNEFIQYLHDFPNLELEKHDFQKQHRCACQIYQARQLTNQNTRNFYVCCAERH